MTHNDPDSGPPTILENVVDFATLIAVAAIFTVIFIVFA